MSGEYSDPDHAAACTAGNQPRVSGEYRSRRVVARLKLWESTPRERGILLGNDVIGYGVEGINPA